MLIYVLLNIKKQALFFIVMNKTDNCRELFLDGVTDAYLYPVQGTSLPIPYNVQLILQMSNCKFSTSFLHLTDREEDDNEVNVENIIVKSTASQQGFGLVFTFELTANVTAGYENIVELNNKMQGKDYYIVLKKQDGTYHLCYTLPHSFKFAVSTQIQQGGESQGITITAKAVSDFIPITLAVL